MERILGVMQQKMLMQTELLRTMRSPDAAQALRTPQLECEDVFDPKSAGMKTSARTHPHNFYFEGM